MYRNQLLKWRPGFWWLWTLLSLLCGTQRCTGRYSDGELRDTNGGDLKLYNFCQPNMSGVTTPRRFFFDERDNGTLVARDVVYNAFVSQGAQRHCSIELTTCPSCSIQLHIAQANLAPCVDGKKCR